jgi:hypothetical protein
MGRPDGVRVKNVPSYRRIMPFFMDTKTNSMIQYDLDLKVEKLMDFCKKISEEYGMKVTPFQCVLHAIFKTHVAYPEVNRFVKGKVLWQRKGIYLSYSVKKEWSTKASISIVKRKFEDDFTLLDTIKVTTKDTEEGRDKKKADQAEKESNLFLWMPTFVLSTLYPIYKFFDEHGLLPSSYIEKDPLYASFFLANVGAFDADTGYHHLYELGTISVFAVMGKAKMIPVVEGDKVVPRKVIQFKTSNDERICDGFYYFKAIDYFRDQLEDPEKLLETAKLVDE